jgi:hypothetical protein
LCLLAGSRCFLASDFTFAAAVVVICSVLVEVHSQVTQNALVAAVSQIEYFDEFRIALEFKQMIEPRVLFLDGIGQFTFICCSESTGVNMITDSYCCLVLMVVL